MTTETSPKPSESELRSEIKAALNRVSAENASGTPDHVLADFLLASLAAFDAATRARDGWWGHNPTIGGTPAVDPETILSSAQAASFERLTADQRELERLRRWKAEASEVLVGMQDLGQALGVRPGHRIYASEAADLARQLRAERDEAVAALAATDTASDRG